MTERTDMDLYRLSHMSLNYLPDEKVIFNLSEEERILMCSTCEHRSEPYDFGDCDNCICKN